MRKNDNGSSGRPTLPTYSRRRIVAAGAALGASALAMRLSTPSLAALPAVAGPLPDSPAHGLQTWDVAGLDYIAEEYFLSGHADTYNPVSMADAPDMSARDPSRDFGSRDFSRPVLAAAQPYTTRLIVYRPREPRRFSGTVIVETLHPNEGGSSLVWGVLHAFFAARGDAYVGVQHPLTFPGVKTKDPTRYGTLAASSTTQIWGMLADAGALLKSHRSPLLTGYAVKRLVMTGYSYTGVATATFANYHHSTAKVAGRNIFDAYIPMACAQYVRPLDVPVLRLDTQSEFNAYGGIKNRRPDDDRYRHYEVAGASHVAVPPPLDAAKRPVAGQIPPAAGLPKFDPAKCYSQFPAGSRPNDFPLDLVQAAMFDNMNQWLEAGRAPPPSALIETQADGSTHLDEWGNAVGGVRYPQVSVPIARYGVGTGPCMLFGFTAPFTADQCKSLYGTHAAYVEKVRARAEELVAGHMLLRTGVERLVTAAQADTTFS